MLQYVLDTCRAAGIERILVVVGFQREQVMQMFAGQQIEFVVQREQRGTADAVLACKHCLKPRDEVMVLNGDVPLLRVQTLTRLIRKHEKLHSDMTLLTARVEDPKGYGRVVRKRGRIVDIIEETDAKPEQLRIREVNVGVYAFRWDRTLPLLKSIKPSPRTGETYLPKLVKLVSDGDGKIASVRAGTSAEFMGINTLCQLREVEAELRRRCVI